MIELAASKTLVLVGTSFRVAPVEVRERLFLDADAASRLGGELAQGTEVVALSTCNRSELYLAGRDPAATTEGAVRAFTKLAHLPRAQLLPSLSVLEEDAAAQHLFRVAAGLESLVPGESQILRQVREAQREASARRSSGALLDRLFSEAVRVGKRVRAETRIGERHESVAVGAVRLARGFFGTLENRRVLIIGAGKMSELAARSLRRERIAELVVANRTLVRAEELARRLGGRPIGFDRLGEALEQVDVVISSTRCPRLVLRAEQVEAARGRRSGRPLLLVDIAVPRDIDPSIGMVAGCSLYGVDDIGGVARGSGLDGADLARAEAIVLEELRRFRDWRRSLRVVPAITTLRSSAEAIRSQELAHAQARLQGLSSRQRHEVEALTAQILNKLLHRPTMRMKAAVGGEGARYACAIEYLFGPGEANE